MKNFNQQTWCESLARKQWEIIGENNDVNKMANYFSDLKTEALDECAPVKKFTNTYKRLARLNKVIAGWK